MLFPAARSAAPVGHPEDFGWHRHAQTALVAETSCIAPAWGPPQCCQSLIPNPSQSPGIDPLLHPRALMELFSHSRSSAPSAHSPCQPYWAPHAGTLWLKGWHSSPSCPRGVHIRSPRSQRLTAQQVPLLHCGSRSQAWGEGQGEGYFSG